MKRLALWGAVLSICTAVSTADAQTPWSSSETSWLSPDLSAAADRLFNYRLASTQDPATPTNETQPEAAAANTPYVDYGNGACATCDTSCFDTCGACCGGWFGGVYAIGLNRSDDFGVELSYDGANPFPAAMTTSAADIDWGAGLETRFGKYLSCYWAMEVAYWGISPSRQEAYVCNACQNIDLTSAIEFDGLLYDAGAGLNPVSDWFGTAAAPAQAHRVRRNFEAHNVEINLIRNPYRRTGCTHFELVGGFRYLKFDDSFSFASNLTSDTFGNDPVNELFYSIDMENHLYGFQIGGRLDHYLCSCLSINGGVKYGLYGNHIKHRQDLASGAGVLAVNGGGNPYQFDVSDDELAGLGELFTGLSYSITPCWKLTGGYRAIHACGVGLATSQIPRARGFRDRRLARAIDAENSLFLHGAYAGIEYNW